ncbi:MAG: hypothetical protein CFH41_02541 [Alphaproteobacteria bacterium MarineAlpha11_Bin1]|nr:MAG: hypothetical protein CFH41_02541 [Alphaproteobacteria bacterium MarineAlpha11_Bin1]|tara:strand:+ start:209 stop:1375 length:1167 start_codon:yes stop_codon:yes gene_type:complete
MVDACETVTVKILSSLSEVSAEDWDGCAGPDNPFISHMFLKTLEDSSAACNETGWLPQHVVIEDPAGGLIGAAPCYLKYHSHGEYVFDWGWADAYTRAGGKYYPKLQVSVPFSPVTGPRLLVRDGEDKIHTRKMLATGLVELAKQHNSSSLHITFTQEEECQDLKEMSFLIRQGQQFHWHNQGFKNFEDFLESLNSRKRKMIRKERDAANAAVNIEVLTGDDLTEHHMQSFYHFYRNTVDRKWAHAYLTYEFFQLLRERMSKNVVLMMASCNGDYVAGALNMRGPDTLWGRNWGCSEHFKMLYFETCFYRGIEFAIENGLSKVEAGAQGPHKISRGYLPSATYSLHWIRDDAFRRAVADFVDRERCGVEHEMDLLSALSPFKISNAPP